ncbi:MAG TPA: putative zinc-binding metallopeptidase [Solirubrobacteraceae bacterium]
MLAFACPVCARLVTFESVRCLNCSSELGYEPEGRTMVALTAAGQQRSWRRCTNATLAACNWVVVDEGELCASCVLTRTRPNDGDGAALGGFASAEAAKRRLLFELIDLGLPVVGWHEQPGGLGFDLLSSEHEAVTTGHADGLITLDLDETDPAHRERMRVNLDERYRTVLGHMRHEIGHYYQPILIATDSEDEARCREIFGDDREDYQEAMDRYYANGAPAAWEQRYVSAYATMHPWEDWAETFAHYLHVHDALQTAAAHGVRVDGPKLASTDPAPLDSAPAQAPSEIGAMLRAWIPLTYALNAINRSMGTRDLYPFVLGPEVEAKLVFIDSLVRAVRV